MEVYIMFFSLILISQGYAEPNQSYQISNVPTRSPSEDLTLNPDLDETTKKRKDSMENCNDTIKIFRHTFERLMETLKPITTLRELIKWYHKESEDVVTLTKYVNKIHPSCDSNQDFLVYREAIRHTYDDRCFYFIDKVYDCGSVFIQSMKTNVAIEFKAILEEKDALHSEPISHDFVVSSDQLSDIHAICNGTIQYCFQEVKPFEPCEGYALEKVLNCSMNDYVYEPFKHFRCSEDWVVKKQKSGQSGLRTFIKKYELTLLFCLILRIFKA